MAKYSEKQNKWTQDYIKKAYEPILVRVKKGKKELYQQAVAEKGVSLNAYIVEKLDELLEE